MNRAEVKDVFASNKKLEQAGFIPANELGSHNLLDYCKRRFNTKW